MIDPLPLLAARLGVALLFLAAATHKLARSARFREALDAYRVFGPTTGALAFAVPLLEFGLGAAVLAPQRAVFAPAIAGAAVLLLAYAGLIMATISAGRRHIDCGCLSFGARRRELNKAQVVRNIVLATIALGALLPSSERPLGWLDAVQLVAALGGAILLYGAFEVANALPRRSPS